MDDKQNCIIREQGEFMEPVELNPEENKTVNDSEEQN